MIVTDNGIYTEAGAALGLGGMAYEGISGKKIGHGSNGKNKESTVGKWINDYDKLDAEAQKNGAEMRSKNGLFTGHLQNKVAKTRAMLGSIKHFDPTPNGYLRRKIENQKKYLTKEDAMLIAEALDDIELYAGYDGNFYVNESDIVDYANTIGYNDYGSMLEDLAIVNDIDVDDIMVVS